MEIQEVIIDGFGKFANIRISGFKKGVNILYGPNEYGKTTLLNFIRRMLFGFPRSSPNVNPYPALNGGSYGGKLICKLDNGDAVIISRTEGPHGGKVSIQNNSSELNDQDALNRLLGNVSGTLYQKVYAISLDELQAIQSLSTEEVKSRIYGAGLGLGNKSLTTIKKDLLTHQENIFKPRGSTQKIPKLYNEIRVLENEIKEMQENLSNYDGLVEEFNKSKNEIDTLKIEITNLEAKKNLSVNQKKLYPTYIDIIDSESTLSQLGKSENYPDNTIERLDNLEIELTGIHKRIDEHKSDLDFLNSKQESISFNKKLIESESDVIALQQSIENFRTATKDIELEESNRSALVDNIQREVNQLGEGWSLSQIEQFQLTHEQKETINSFKDRFINEKDRARTIENKLELYRDQKLANFSKGFIGPEFYKYAIYAIILIGLLGVGFGLYSSQINLNNIPSLINSQHIYLIGFSFLIFIIGSVIAWHMKSKSTLDSIDPLEQAYLNELQEQETTLTNINMEWNRFLSTLNLEEGTTVETVLDIVASIEYIKKQVATLDQNEKRILNLDNIINNVKQIHDKVISVIEEPAVSTEISANIEYIQRKFAESADNKRQKENNEKLITELENKIDNLSSEKQSKLIEKQNYIRSLNANDEDDLKNKYKIFKKREEILEKINGYKKIIQSNVGTNKDYEDFLNYLKVTNPETIENELNKIISHLDEIKEERDTKNQYIGELNNKIDDIASHQDLLVKQNEIEVKKQQLNDLSVEWTKFQIAGVMLNKAIFKYENTRQPNVIKAAEEIFFHLTDKSYTNITKPIEKDDLFISDEFGNRKGVLELSRGTKEQLYFAMRLGLIKEYESQSESMPIIMDDIFVNFDDDRGPLAMEALHNFALSRQVIVLTCHKNMCELYKGLGVNEVAII